MSSDDLALTETRQAVLQSTGSPAAEGERSTRLSATLEAGKSYRALTVTRSTAAGMKEGVILHDVFIPLAHPPDMQDGQAVQVRVLATQPRIELQFAVASEKDAAEKPLLSPAGRALLEKLVHAGEGLRESVTVSHRTTSSMRVIDSLLDRLTLSDTAARSGADSVEQVLRRLLAPQPATEAAMQQAEQQLAASAQLLRTLASTERATSAGARVPVPQLQAIAAQVPAIAADSSFDQVSASIKQMLGRVQSHEPVAFARITIKELQALLIRSDSSSATELTHTLERLDASLRQPEAAGVRSAEIVERLGNQLGAVRQQADQLTVPEQGATRRIAVLVKELAAHVENVRLQLTVGISVESSVKEIFSAASTGSGHELLRTLESRLVPQLAAISSRAPEELSQLARSIVRVVRNQAEAGADGTLSSQRLEQIAAAEPVAQVMQILDALRLATADSSSGVERRIMEFATHSLQLLHARHSGGGLPGAAQQQDILLQIEKNLQLLYQAVPGLEPAQPTTDSQPGLPGLTPRVRTLMYGLDALLKTAITETAALLEKGDVYPSAEFVKRLQDSMSTVLTMLRRESGEGSERIEHQVQQLQNFLLRGDGKPAPLADILVQLQQLQQAAQQDATGSSGLQLQLQQLLQTVITGARQEFAAVESGQPDTARLLQQVRQQVTRALQAHPHTAPTLPSDLEAAAAQFLQQPAAAVPASLRELIGQARELMRADPQGSSLLDSLEQIMWVASNGVESAASHPQVPAPSGLAALEQLLSAQLPGSTAGLQIPADVQLLMQLVAQIRRGDSPVTSPLEQSILSAVQQLSVPLEQAMQGDVRQQQAVLREFSDLVRGEISRALSGREPGSDLQKTLQALRGLENLVRGQEALMQMAPLLEATGDPVFVLFPALLGGLLSRIELTYYPARQEHTDPDSGKKHGAGGQFQKSEMTLTLASLGAVAVRFAHRGEEILCELQFENEKAADFVERRLPRLEQAFERSGFSQLSCSVSVGPVQSCAPEWYSALPRPGIIA